MTRRSLLFALLALAGCRSRPDPKPEVHEADEHGRINPPFTMRANEEWVYEFGPARDDGRLVIQRARLRRRR